MEEKTNIQKLLEKDSRGHFSDPNKKNSQYQLEKKIKFVKNKNKFLA